MHTAKWLLVVLALFALSGPVGAEEVGAPDVGSRVRVSARDAGLWYSKGTIQAIGQDTMAVLLDADSIVRDIPLHSISRLEIRVGRKGHALQGAGIGLLLGALAGGAIGAAYEGDIPGFELIHVAVGVAGGGLGGLLVGTIVGAAISSDRWKTVHQVGDVQLGVRMLEGRAIVATISLGH